MAGIKGDFPSGRVVLHRCPRPDIPAFGLRLGTVWSLLAAVRPDLLHHVATAALHSHQVWGGRRLLQQRVQGARPLSDHWHRHFGLWAARHTGKEGCDKVGSLWTGDGRKQRHLPHHSWILPGVRRRRRLQLGTVVEAFRAGVCWSGVGVGWRMEGRGGGTCNGRTLRPNFTTRYLGNNA